MFLLIFWVLFIIEREGVCVCERVCKDGWHKKWHTHDLLPCEYNPQMLADTSDKNTGSHTKFIFTLLSLHCWSFWQAHGQAPQRSINSAHNTCTTHSKITQNKVSPMDAIEITSSSMHPVQPMDSLWKNEPLCPVHCFPNEFFFLPGAVLPGAEIILSWCF